MSQTMEMKEQASGENVKLRVSRVIRAKRERVFEAWTKPEIIRQWFGPGNLTVASASVDFRVGGAYRIEMSGSSATVESSPSDANTAQRPSATGIYKAIIPNQMLCFTWRGDWSPAEDTLVTVELRDVEGGTELTLMHERFATTESRDRHEHGWNGSLEKLAKVMEK